MNRVDDKMISDAGAAQLRITNVEVDYFVTLQMYPFEAIMFIILKIEFRY